VIRKRNTHSEDQKQQALAHTILTHFLNNQVIIFELMCLEKGMPSFTCIMNFQFNKKHVNQYMFPAALRTIPPNPHTAIHHLSTVLFAVSQKYSALHTDFQTAVNITIINK